MIVDGTSAFKVTTIWGGNEYYFFKIVEMCRVMNWNTQQFRNHKSRHDNDKSKKREDFIYKECKVEKITIE